MFLGRYEHTIDEKGRLTIPARYRELLENGAYVTQGFDHNLIVLPAPSFEKMYEHVNQMSMTDPTARQLKRFIFSSAERCRIRPGRPDAAASISPRSSQPGWNCDACWRRRLF